MNAPHTARTDAPAPRLAQRAEELWEAVVRADEITATALVLDALEGGLDAESALLDVIAPVQGRVGEEWAANRLTVAQEHAATAINDRVIAALSRHPAARTTEYRGRVTVACVDGEWHALPARLLAEVLTLRGWRVDYLGAQVPTPHLIAHLHRTGPGVVALSSSIATRLPTAHAAISACRATGVPVLVGGAAFGPDGRYAYLLGADAWAADARGAADRLAQGVEAPLDQPLLPVDDLPHLEDQEYTMVARSQSRLVAAALFGLGERVPAVREYTEQQRERTAEDLAHIVDFLAAALYTDDADLFAGFLTWTAGILTARGVPGRSLLPVLDILGDELKDFPRAVRHLRLATARISTAGSPALAASGKPV